MVATCQLCSVYTLIIDWIFNNKTPELINILGCILLVCGVFAFQFIGQYQQVGANDFAEWEHLLEPQFLWANLSAFLFAIFQYMQENVLHTIPEEFVVGLLGLCMTVIGWIPAMIAHIVGHEIFNVPSRIVMLLIFLNGFGSIIGEYCAMYAVRTTSAFIFTGTLAWSSPVSLLMTYMVNKIKQTNTDIWTWWYLPTLVFIIIGCCFIYYNDAENEKDTASEDKQTVNNTIIQIAMHDTKNRQSDEIQE